MNQDLKRNIILDYNQNMEHRHHIDDPTYQTIPTNNPSCIDQFDLQIKTENNQIVDLLFTGDGCVISTATTAIMSELLTGKNVDEALKITENYLNMINEQPYEKDLLQAALAFEDIYKQANRKSCATLTWQAVADYLKN